MQIIQHRGYKRKKGSVQQKTNGHLNLCKVSIKIANFTEIILQIKQNENWGRAA